MVYIVTGGAGFIGSNVVAELEARKLGPIIVIDDMGNGSKWKNLSKRTHLAEVYPTSRMGEIMGQVGNVKKGAIIHMGARSSTREANVDDLVRTNSVLTTGLFKLCAEHKWPFVYASSAQVYGLSRDMSDADEIPLRPITPYGWSKALADQGILRMAKDRVEPPIWAGLRFFNVYGPCEDHKGDDRSFVSRCFDAILGQHPIKVFRGSDGFVRDWVYVRDCARLAVDVATGVTPLRGIFNVGTGKPVDFIRVAETCIISANRQTHLHTVDFPREMAGSYQAYTCADTRKLATADPGRVFAPLADGAKDMWVRSSGLDGMDRFP